MRVLTLIFLLVISGCAKNMHTHEINHCGGIDIPICNVEVEGEMSLEDQEKLIKHINHTTNLKPLIKNENNNNMHELFKVFNY